MLNNAHKHKKVGNISVVVALWNIQCFHMQSDTINVTAVFCFGAVAHTEWVSGSWIEMMHLPPAILSQAPPKRLQIAQMGDISACYRIATYFLLLLWQKLLMQSFKKQEGEMQSERTHFTAIDAMLPAGLVNGEKRLENGFCSGSFSTFHCLSDLIPLCL